MLKELFNKYNCDKSAKHHYHTVYNDEFSKFKDLPINLLEIGTFKGNSIEAWVEYFPNATIYTIDIFSRIPADEINILTHERVKWLKADSMDPNINEQINNAWGDIKFDIIIDDGLHTPLANKLTFDHIKHFMSQTAVYFIEDVWPLDKMTEAELTHSWIQSNRVDYTLDRMNEFNNSISEYARTDYDLRLISKQPDSYIIKLTKNESIHNIVK